ncbi:MAG TPA: TonB-dependent receptor [Usitatibacter sp.]|nr:TonB-dependent receptor [Usitatibacter sp.]
MSPSSRRSARALLVLLAALATALPHGATAQENPAEAVELGKVEVVGTTPLPGLGVAVEKVPANVQIFSRGLQQRPATLPDFLDRGAIGAIASSGQGNPFQPDLSYRGFAASPLLGLPQGLGVFQDGVRINEPFGDVVNWDLVPMSAIGSIQLIPGTTPMFGPNALGGTLAVYTKSGARFPGGGLEAYAGSWARRALEVEQGGSHGDWDYFLTGNLLRDRGWAQHNPSRIGQFFAKVGHQTARSDFDVSLTVADNTLEGNQALPLSFLDDIRQPYTYPDRNTNRAALLAAKGSYFLGDAWLAGGTAYIRRYRNENFASNVNADPDVANGAEATNDLATIDQDSFGTGLQLTGTGKLLGRDNQVLAGMSVDAGRARYMRRTQPARFTGSRGTEATGDFVTAIDADTSNAHYAAFVSDTVAIADAWSLTLSAREDTARISIDDRSGSDPQLTGDHRFSRLNPAAGLTFSPSDRLTAYAAYSEGMRAPTAMELTCADPAAPCKLPNAFLSDPPLQAIIARTAEAGLRGRWGDAGRWSAAAFRTALANDIQFVSAGAGALNAGYFRNVGSTRRAGVELAASDRLGRWEIGARYSWIRATFDTPFVEHSPNNSSADAAGDILVAAGDRIPGIPEHALKLTLDYAHEEWSAGLAGRAASRVHARGDENNRDAQGSIPGYAVLDLHAHWRVSRSLELFAFADNIFDKRYAGQGLLGLNVFNGPGHAFTPDAGVPEQFRGMGAPRGAWLGLRYRWD